MTHHLRSRLVTATLIASLLLISACDTSQAVGPEEESDLDVLFRFAPKDLQANPSGTFDLSGTFTASGSLNDHGRYEETLGLGERLLYGYRRLEGSRGTVGIQYTGSVSTDGRRGHIRYTIVHGTESYAGLTGTGEFEMELPGASASEATSSITARLSKR